MWNCLWGNALKRSPGIIRKSRVWYPVPGFLSSATWPSLPKKHYYNNGLNQTKPSCEATPFFTRGWPHVRGINIYLCFDLHCKVTFLEWVISHKALHCVDLYNINIPYIEMWVSFKLSFNWLHHLFFFPLRIYLYQCLLINLSD